MSNLHSVLGGAAWMAVATLLLLATFEPTPALDSDARYAAAKVVTGYADA